MQIAPWQVPVLMMAGIVASVSVLWMIEVARQPRGYRRRTLIESARSSKGSAASERRRIAVLAILTVLLLGILGKSFADVIAAVASAISALVAAALALLSYWMNQVRLDSRERDLKKDVEGIQQENEIPPKSATTPEE